MREWRNRQTRTFEGRVVNTVRVQVPFLAPKKKEVNRRFTSFFFRLNKPTPNPAIRKDCLFCAAMWFEFMLTVGAKLGS